MLTPAFNGISYLLGHAHEIETGLYARRHRKKAILTVLLKFPCSGRAGQVASVPLIPSSRRFPCPESPYRTDDFAGSGQLI